MTNKFIKVFLFGVTKSSETCCNKKWRAFLELNSNIHIEYLLMNESKKKSILDPNMLKKHSLSDSVV